MMRKMLVALCMLTLSGCSGAAAPPAHPPTKSVANQTTTQSAKPVKLYTEVEWRDWGDVALLRAKLKHRPVALYFYDEGCGYCEMMDKTTFSDPAIIELLNTNFVPIKARGADHEDIMQTLFGATAYPGLAFLAPDGTLLVAVNGYVPPANYKKALVTIIKAMAD
jgi:uncharacterized protein YyaL (SSP411 family)